MRRSPRTWRAMARLAARWYAEGRDHRGQGAMVRVEPRVAVRLVRKGERSKMRHG